jgi:enoyl-CoA hydratase
MKALETLKIESPQEHTVLVTLNRPEAANAMNTQMGLDLLEMFLCGSEPAALHCDHRLRP